MAEERISELESKSKGIVRNEGGTPKVYKLMCENAYVNYVPQKRI